MSCVLLLRKLWISPISSWHCVAHKKHRLTYHAYAASIFFARALFHLELELIQSFRKNTIFHFYEVRACLGVSFVSPGGIRRLRLRRSWASLLLADYRSSIRSFAEGLPASGNFTKVDKFGFFRRCLPNDTILDRNANPGLYVFPITMQARSRIC